MGSIVGIISHKNLFLATMIWALTTSVILILWNITWWDTNGIYNFYNWIKVEIRH